VRSRVTCSSAPVPTSSRLISTGPARRTWRYRPGGWVPRPCCAAWVARPEIDPTVAGGPERVLLLTRSPTRRATRRARSGAARPSRRAGGRERGRGAPTRRATRRPRAGRAADPAARAGRGHPGPMRGRRGRRERGPRPCAHPRRSVDGAARHPARRPARRRHRGSHRAGPSGQDGRAHPARTRRTTRSARSPAWSCRAFYRRDPPPPCACRRTPCRTTSSPSSLRSGSAADNSWPPCSPDHYVPHLGRPVGPHGYFTTATR
jgi:hypothetical protein